MTFFGMALVTAAGTIVLAVFAIVTAAYARKAFLKQSQEVAAIERQVSDEQEPTRQQAELIKVQTGQLEVLREQLEDQRKASAAQAEVLELQAAELRESLEERKCEAERQHRAQASRVYIIETRFGGRLSGRGSESIRGIGAKPPSVTATVHRTPATSRSTTPSSGGTAVPPGTANRTPSRSARCCPASTTSGNAPSRKAPTWKPAAPSSASATLPACAGCCDRTGSSPKNRASSSVPIQPCRHNPHRLRRPAPPADRGESRAADEHDDARGSGPSRGWQLHDQRCLPPA